MTKMVTKAAAARFMNSSAKRREYLQKGRCFLESVRTMSLSPEILMDRFRSVSCKGSWEFIFSPGAYVPVKMEGGKKHVGGGPRPLAQSVICTSADKWYSRSRLPGDASRDHRLLVGSS